MLAGTITLTPGTVSADLSDEGHSLLVHALMPMTQMRCATKSRPLRSPPEGDFRMTPAVELMDLRLIIAFIACRWANWRWSGW